MFQIIFQKSYGVGSFYLTLDIYNIKLCSELDHSKLSS